MNKEQSTPASEAQPPAPAPRPDRPWILAAVMLAMFMIAVEGTIVATAMPTIVADLGGFQLYSWVFAIYLLTQAVTIPIYGKLADMAGRKPVLFAGVAVFLLGSVLAGFSRDMMQLIGFRALQGFGAGAVQPIALTIVGDIYTAKERARIQGYLSSVWGISAVIGPMLGAFLVEQAHWSFVFWVNVPIGVACVALLAVFLNEQVGHKKHKVDYAGSALLMTGTTALMLALIQGQSLSGGTEAGLLLAAGLCLAGFLAQERRAAEPMMPLGLWARPMIAIGNSGALVTGALMIGVVSFLPAYVQGVMGRSAAVSGSAVAAVAIGWPLAGTIGGRLMGRTSYRFTAVLGAGFLILGSVFLIALTPRLGPLWAGAGAFLIGAGMGFSTTTYLVSIQTSVGWDERGVATSSNMFMRMVGQAVGAAVFGAVLNLGLSRAAAGSNDLNRMMQPATRSLVAPAQLASLADSMAGALHGVFLIGGGLALVSLALALYTPRNIKP